MLFFCKLLFVSFSLLRMVDGETLLQVRLVSKRWNQICNSDRIIRKKIRNHLKQRKIQIIGLLGDISYVPKSQTTVFRKKNLQYDFGK